MEKERDLSGLISKAKDVAKVLALAKAAQEVGKQLNNPKFQELVNNIKNNISTRSVSDLVAFLKQNPNLLQALKERMPNLSSLAQLRQLSSS